MRFAAGLICLLLMACSGVDMKPGETSRNRREIPPGPGLFSGSDGEFVVFRSTGPAEKEGPAAKPAPAAENQTKTK